ncbi:MAG: DUF3299 domain-containing protein [Gammaproteobacteria bacterium]|nr:DUF3299 domain-containing protein [Gammaproteobacteria bacterium]
MLNKKLLLLLIIGTLSSCDSEPLLKKKSDPITTNNTLTNNTVARTDKNEGVSAVKEIGWDSLIPESALPDQEIVERYNNGELDDDAPEMIALRAQIKELEEKAPVNEELDGKTVKIPGYVVPIEMEGSLVKEFLLVPYQGACIHTPPPPSNQTIYVKTDENSAGKFENFDTVWVTGTINIEKTSHELAETGFTLKSSKVEFYE